MHRFLYLAVLSTFCTLGGIGSIAAQEPAPDTAAVTPPVAALAVMANVVADMPEGLPR